MAYHWHPAHFNSAGGAALLRTSIPIYNNTQIVGGFDGFVDLQSPFIQSPFLSHDLPKCNLGKLRMPNFLVTC